ncbi:MAG: hypothetical protein JO069_03025 [Verrucomicrobia bacterium]|nr:hypothetical protein [Verrucomicrobiota bacterium]
MALSAEYVALLRAGIEAAPEWKEAWLRVNDYLDALKMPEDLDRELILLSSFERAITRKRTAAFVPATQLAFEETQRSLDRMFGHLVREGTRPEARSVEERVRLYLTEADAYGGFRRSQTVPRELLEALRDVRLETSPALQPASITPKPLEFTHWGERCKGFAQRLSALGSGRARLLAWVMALILLLFLAITSI